ncbi:MAG TPA: DUF58 domain-containing protein [Acidimicrobiales bacterium]|nr:DUF58 domain-containing protein [Acidimicrobiales bacterium]
MTAPVTETQRFSAEVGTVSRFARRQRRFTDVTGITSTGAVLLALAVLCWLLGYLAGGRPLYLGSYLMLGMFFIAYAIGRRPLPLTGERADARPRLREGETINMEVSLTAARSLSTFILDEEVPERLGSPAQVPIASLQGGESVTHGYRLTMHRRGVYRLGPLRARWGDPFGFTQRSLTLAEPFEVLVHPSVELVQDRPLTRLFEDPPIRPPISKPWPSGMEFYGMRKYNPGDDLRRIVWRAFARTGQLLVRESEQGITDKITVVVDNRRTHHSHDGAVSESFETAVKAAASLGTRHLREGYSVTLELNEARPLPPLRGGNSQMMFLDALARAELGDKSIVDAVMRLVSDPSRDAHIVIITPYLEPDDAARIRLLVQRGASVLIAALVWDETDERTIDRAAAIGAQVVEIRPRSNLAVAFSRDVGMGR